MIVVPTQPSVNASEKVVVDRPSATEVTQSSYHPYGQCTNGQSMVRTRRSVGVCTRPDTTVSDAISSTEDHTQSDGVCDRTTTSANGMSSENGGGDGGGCGDAPAAGVTGSGHHVAQILKFKIQSRFRRPASLKRPRKARTFLLLSTILHINFMWLYLFPGCQRGCGHRGENSWQAGGTQVSFQKASVSSCCCF